MVDYRGVDKEDVINSLRQAEAFLRQLNLGPATTKNLDSWLAKDPYSKIEAATDRKALAQAMSETGSAWVFLRAGQVFRHHALADTNGIGLKIYQGVASWGGFDGAMTLEYGQVDEEHQVHLAVECAKFVAAQGEKLSATAQKNIDTVMDELRENYPDDLEECAVIEQQIHDMIIKTRQGDIKGAAHEYLQNDLNIRYTIEEALQGASGLADQKLAVIWPLARYGIVIDKPSKNFEEMKAATDSLRTQMDTLLKPFYETDEVGMTGIGSITDDWQKSGIIFEATKPAAQAVANKMPQCVVIDHTGKRIMPSAKAVAPKAKKKPQSPKT